MCTGVTQARVLGMDAVLCAGTGNTSASMAAYAARAGMLGIVLIPDGQIAFGKLSQSLDYGALTLQVAGDFDALQKLVPEIARDANVYVLNSVECLPPGRPRQSCWRCCSNAAGRYLTAWWCPAATSATVRRLVRRWTL